MTSDVPETEPTSSISYATLTNNNIPALGDIHVLDLSDASLQYCGKLFANLGADVLLIEPPGGCSTRREGPYVNDVVHTEQSLTFAYLNQGKEGICLDLDTPDGRSILHRLAEKADLLIHSEHPESQSRKGLAFEQLKEINPELIVTSITGFGLSGPYSSYYDADLVSMALGGLLYLGGYPETEPIGAPGAHAYLAAAQFAAVASLAPFLQDMSNGPMGRLVDVSIQECVAMALENAIQFLDLENTVRKRTGGQQRQAGTGVFPCRDGLVYLMAGGIASNRFWAATAQWLIDGDALGAHQLLGEEWADSAYLATDAAKVLFQKIFVPFSMKFTKAELYEAAQKRRVPLCPVSTTADLMVNRQLIHRNYFESALHPYSQSILTMPGAPYQLSATPWRQGRPAPQLGEHTAKILSQLGYDFATQAALLRERVTG